VMSLLFGLAALISGPRVIGTRDVLEAGSVGKAVEVAEAAREADPGRRSAWHNFAVWLIAFGAALVLLYFALWGALG
jgi:hypothetical protein